MFDCLLRRFSIGSIDFLSLTSPYWFWMVFVVVAYSLNKFDGLEFPFLRFFKKDGVLSSYLFYFVWVYLIVSYPFYYLPATRLMDFDIPCFGERLGLSYFFTLTGIYAKSTILETHEFLPSLIDLHIQDWIFERLYSWCPELRMWF